MVTSPLAAASPFSPQKRRKPGPEPPAAGAGPWPFRRNAGLPAGLFATEYVPILF
jgi:hypothetical protein